VTSLDDLLSHADEATAPRPPAQRLAAWVGKAVPGAAALGAALVLVLRLFGLDLSFPLAVAAFLALLALRRAVVALQPVALRRTRAVREAAADPPAPDALALAVAGWQARLNWSRAGAGRFPRAVRPRLAEVIDERLRQRHGFTRTGDPVRARRVLGERLWSFLAGPADRIPPSRDLAELLADVEKI
jgi:hypothetical protein